MLAAGHWQVIAEMFVERVANSMVEGMAIALFAWILLRTLRRTNSSTRFAVWFAAILAVVLLPLFEKPAAGNAALAQAHSALRLPGSVAIYLFLGWAIIACAGLLKIGFGFVRLRKLRQGCTVVEPESLHCDLRSTLNRLESSRRVVLLTSERVRVPAAIGFFTPAIVIPKWALNELSPTELNTVLLHELAHLQRWDDWTNLAQRILGALLFFHPAMWWIDRGLSREREMACDDFVLAATSDAHAYAECLVTLAEKSLLRRSLVLAQAAIGRVQETAHRVARILDAERPVATKVWKPALGLVSAVSVACLVTMSHAPALVAFEASAPDLSVPAHRLMSFESAAAGAKVIPAAFHEHASHATAKLAGPSRVASPVAAVPSTGMKMASAKSVRPEEPRAIDVSARSSGDRVATPHSVLLVMQTQQVDEYGRIWNVCVWRLTVFHPVVREVHTVVVPKTT